jgi:glutathione peroxidase
MAKTVYDFSCATTGGKKKSLADYKGKVLLVVNTASKCGFTPQFEGLEEMYEKYKDEGLEILGFPCNQFGKIEVNGGGTDPLFKHLKKEAPGALGTERIKWNFTKFLIDTDGNVVKRYAPTDKPKAIAKDVKKLLA